MVHRAAHPELANLPFCVQNAADTASTLVSLHDGIILRECFSARHPGPACVMLVREAGESLELAFADTGSHGPGWEPRSCSSFAWEESKRLVMFESVSMR